MSEIIEVETVEITPRPRGQQLRAVWSREAEQDLRAVHNIAAEMVLTDMLVTEIQNEIDAEILHGLQVALQPPPTSPPRYSDLYFEAIEQVRRGMVEDRVDWKREGF
jgi:hypothetical protein